MRFVLVLFVAYASFMVGASGAHLDITRMMRVHFACESKEQMIAMIGATGHAKRLRGEGLVAPCRVQGIEYWVAHTGCPVGAAT